MVKTMAPEDRDRNFDKAIARHLRSTAASSDSAKQAAGTPSLRDACPDAETLAAYQERAGSPPPASTRGTAVSPEVQRSPSKPSSTADTLSSYSKLPDSRGLRKQQTDESKTRRS